ncbi:hypothetical protein ACS0TY_001405 [Phlomoides rotata]
MDKSGAKTFTVKNRSSRAVLTVSVGKSTRNPVSTLQTLFLDFYCLWMVLMLLPAKKWLQQCPVQKVLHIRGLQQCIETVMSEVERLLSAEQKATDYRSPDDGITPDHRPTNACIRVTACNA